MSFKWSGTDPIKKLDELKGAKKRTILRKAVLKGAREIRKDLKEEVPVRSGALKKSLWQKVKTGKDGRVYALVGARRGFEFEFDGKIVKPSKYQKLVDQGHGSVEGVQFMEKTWDKHGGGYLETVQKTVSEEFQKVIGG